MWPATHLRTLGLEHSPMWQLGALLLSICPRFFIRGKLSPALGTVTFPLLPKCVHYMTPGQSHSITLHRKGTGSSPAAGEVCEQSIAPQQLSGGNCGNGTLAHTTDADLALSSPFFLWVSLVPTSVCVLSPPWQLQTCRKSSGLLLPELGIIFFGVLHLVGILI